MQPPTQRQPYTASVPTPRLSDRMPRGKLSFNSEPTYRPSQLLQDLAVSVTIALTVTLLARGA